MTNTISEDSVGETIDGRLVTEYFVKFKNDVPIDEDLAMTLANGDNLGFIVVGSVGLPTFKNVSKTSEEVRKTIHISIVDLYPMTTEKAYFALDQSNKEQEKSEDIVSSGKILNLEFE